MLERGTGAAEIEAAYHVAMTLRRAVLFDLDGVLADTSELHYQSWQRIADELHIPFDRTANDALRGLSREESLARVLGCRLGEFSAPQRAELTRRKNDDYLERVARMGPTDVLPGVLRLFGELKQSEWAIAVASSSRNALLVLSQLGIAPRLDAIVDGNDAPRSKPDPQVFLLAAERLHVRPASCVVIEDAESGIVAARAAGMRVVGIGPRERVRGADRVAASLLEISAADILALLDMPQRADGALPMPASCKNQPSIRSNG